MLRRSGSFRAVLGTLLLALLPGACADEPASTDAFASGDLIGGSFLSDGQLPSTLLIQRACSASKVGPRHILIAAHCVHESTLRPQYAAGQRISVTFAAKVIRSSVYQKLTIRKTTVSPDWLRACVATPDSCHDVYSDYSRRASDVALIETDEEIQGGPAAFIDTEPLSPGEQVLVTGYGCQNSVGAPWSYQNAYLKAGITRVLPPTALLHPGSAVTSATMPVVARHDVVTPGPAFVTPGPGLCPGDSGGPLYRARGQGATIVGINGGYSFSSRTAGLPVTNLHTRLDDQSEGNVARWLSSLGALTCRGASCPVGTLGAVTSDRVGVAATDAALDAQHDPACQRDVLDVTSVTRAVYEALGVAANCLALEGERHNLVAGGYVYSARITCAVPSREYASGPPTAAATTGFSAAMAARGFPGFAFIQGQVWGTRVTEACSTYPTRDEVCRASLPPDTVISRDVRATLGVEASCRTNAVQLQSIGAAADTAYVGAVSCTLASRPSDAAVASFSQLMAQRYYYNFAWLPASNTATGVSVSWPCSSF